MNKRFLILTLIVSIVLVFTGSALAVPRMQSYIVGSEYLSTWGSEEDSWIYSGGSPFTYRAVGYWDIGTQPQPRYDEMSVYVLIGVPQGQTGTISISGMDVDFTGYDVNVSLTDADFGQSRPTDSFVDVPNPSLYNHEPMGSADYYMVYLGQVNNQSVDAYHYDHGLIHEPGWGGEIDVDVSVSGFEWVHFDALGVGMYDEQTYVNPYSHDASYVPEPGSLSLLGIGLLGMVPILRRKRR